MSSLKASSLRLFKTSERIGVVMVIAGAFLISFSGVYVKLAHVTPSVAGVYRTLFGGMILLVVVHVRGERIWKGKPYFLLGMIAAGIFALDLFVWHRSIHYVGPGLATILANFQAFFLTLFGVLVLKERPGLGLIAAICLAFVGIYLLTGLRWTQLEQVYKLGLLLGILAALCYAAYILVLRKLQSLDGAPSAAANLAVISLVSALLLGIQAWSKGESFAIVDLQTFLSLFAYGFFSQVIGWMLITKGLPSIRSSLAGLLLLLQPSLALLWDILIFDRETDVMGGVGAVLALAAIYIGTVHIKKSSAS